MTEAPFRIIPLDGRDRTVFSCGDDALDRYFHSQVSQDIRRRVAACYIAVHGESGAVAGFYTLSAADIPLTDLPPDLIKRLPRYPGLPAARLGRLATDIRFRGQKLGAALLADAILRAANSQIAVYAMIVDAKDAEAEAFYRHHGFMQLSSAPRKLFAPLTTLMPRG